MKKLILALLTLPFLSTQAIAAKWDQASLDKASSQLIKQLDLFLTQAPQSDLYQVLNEQQQRTLREKLNHQTLINPSAGISYNNLKDKQKFSQQLYNFVSDSLYGERLIPYLYLYAQQSGPEIQYYLYSALINDDNTNIQFAYPAFQRYISQHGNLKGSNEYWQQFVNNYGFQLQDINVDSSLDNPLVCLNFSQVVNPEPLQQWKPFLKVSSQTVQQNIQWQYQGDRLCFNGDWATDYTIQVNPKLQSEYRLGLTNPTEQGTVKVQASTGQRTPMVRFANNGNVLSVYNERNLTLESANVGKVNLELWQIPANNLAGYDVRDLIASPQNSDSWQLDSTLDDNARLLFEGHFQVEEKGNKTTATNIFFDDLVSDKNNPGKQQMKAGVYVLKASQDDDNDNSATIAFTLSNNGFTAYKTAQGLWVEVRDLDSKKPVSGQNVTLYAKDNDILGNAKTDSNGLAFFEQAAISGERGAQPSHIIATDDQRMGYLDLISSGIDLSNKGLSGELENPLMQSWIWFDRGIYRPNDTANAMFLLKTPDGKSFDSASIWATLIRPDGKTFSVSELKPQANGAYYFEQYFSSVARLGSWKLVLSLAKDGKGYIAEHSINVAAILPQQIAVQTTAKNPVLLSGETALFDIKADWLYGAPAADQQGYVNWTIQAQDGSIEKWKEWQIGLFDENIKALSKQDSLTATDKQGLSQFSLPLNNLPRTTKPLALTLQGTIIEPSGQEVSNTLQTNIQRTEPYIVLKTTDKIAQTALINDQGEQLNGKLDWKLYRVNYNWYWYRSGNSWNYKLNETRQLSSQGSVNATSNEITSFQLPINDGSWVLEVQGENALSAASLPIEYGNWSQPSINNAPDTISISSDKARYQDGEQVKVRLRAPFDGPASVKLATREIVDNYQVTFKNGEADLNFKWKSEWAQGLWLLANGWNQNPSENQNLRAVGLYWLGNDLQNVNLNLQLNSPEEVLPNQKITLPLQLASPANKQTWVQVAVVDEGLYQLAKASFTNPLEAFWGKKQINLEMFDVWGSVIKQVKARQAAIRSGADGDAAGEAGTVALPDLDIDLLTYWSKPTQIDSQGKAQVELDLPQFNGKVRIMAVAWNPQQIGSVEKTMIVKEPLVTQLNTPLFLSIGDSTDMKVRLHNTTDAVMQLGVDMTANGLVTFKDNKQQQTIKLQPKQEITLSRTFTVANSGKAEFSLQIRGDFEKKLERFAEVRKPALPFNRLTLNQLNPGTTWQSPAVEPAQGSLFEQNITLSNRAPFDPQEVLGYLSTYPYGCVEQTTSASWNNLLLDNLIPGYNLPTADYPNQAERYNNLSTAQLRLANMQASDGGFGLWGGDQTSVWLTAYVGDFLLGNKELAKKSFSQENMLNRTLDYLYQSVNNADYSQLHRSTSDTTAYAYALYVLAKAGEQTQGALLKALPIVAKESDIYPARLFILNALLLQGEVGKVAEQMALIAQAPKAISFGYANYGSELRDYANEMVLLYELKNQLVKLNINNPQLGQNLDSAISTVWTALLGELKSTQYLDTQSAHWLAKLATLLPQGQGAAKLEVNGEKISVDGLKKLVIPVGTSSFSVNNQGSVPAFVSLNQWITPPQAAKVNNGYTLELTLRDLQGNPVDRNQLKLNDFVLLEFKLEKTATAPKTDADMILVYSLPAGFKVAENMPFDHIDEGDASSQLVPEFTENRDDRHVAAFIFGQDQTMVLHRLVVRASSIGDWNAPAATLENMYQPQYRAVLPSDTITIKP